MVWPWPHFSFDELVCTCGCGTMGMYPDYMKMVEDARVILTKPMIVSGPYRCPEHNASTSKTGTTGPHTTGRALDFGIQGEDAYDLVKIALALGFTGIGIHQKGDSGRFIHLDNLRSEDGFPRPRIWSY